MQPHHPKHIKVGQVFAGSTPSFDRKVLQVNGMHGYKEIVFVKRGKNGLFEGDKYRERAEIFARNSGHRLEQ